MAMLDPMVLEPFRKQFPQISKAQCPCVFLYSLGFSIVKIAKMLGLHAKTVETHLKNASKTLDIESSGELRGAIQARLMLVVLSALAAPAPLCSSEHERRHTRI